ncbi:threonine-phosphate decarboxylase CobD [Lihuaxuella thermophila]|uniref:threonine-phosphate decarboxylase n=1 Tax=Lihuaxuella thermophila TaxID=1173111 RepID=A0A1H8AH64_9BACL|nr:threonine-phosphate decarboxylase CobD [Lihuaxuella thermophila]SEM69149.1 threonine-phosphate decarboxylase [Lihuaxuella thermophila]
MAQLERFGHGGDLMTATELFGVAVEDLIDFSSNIYPFGPPPAVVEKLKELLAEPGLASLTRYPDPDSRKLKRAIASFHGIEPSRVLTGNGAAELIDLLISVFKPGRAGTIEPAFAEYAGSARKRGIPVVSCITSWENRFVPTLDEVKSLIDESDLLIVGTPNNPTGHLLSVPFLEEMAEYAAKAEKWLVIDEAFIDFVPDGERRSFVHRVDSFPTTVVVRSMTKFYALPGLRLGYLVASEPVIKKLKQMQVPWSVNALAQEAGCVVLDESIRKDFAQEVLLWLSEEKKRLTAELKKIKELEVFPGEANYLLLRFRERAGHYSADWLQHELGKKGFLIRDCSMYPGLDERYFRIAVKTSRANRVLVRAIDELISKEG